MHSHNKNLLGALVETVTKSHITVNSRPNKGLFFVFFFRAPLYTKINFFSCLPKKQNSESNYGQPWTPSR